MLCVIKAERRAIKALEREMLDQYGEYLMSDRLESPHPCGNCFDFACVRGLTAESVSRYSAEHIATLLTSHGAAGHHCVHLLLGGDGKSADFSPLTRYLQGEKLRVYCFGPRRADH